MRFFTLIIFASLILITSCYKDAVIVDEKVLIKDHPSIPSNGEVVGKLINEYGTSINNYSYQFTENFIDVDDYSYYFDLTSGNQNGTVVTVNHRYESSEFTLKPINGELNYIQHCVFTQLEPRVESSIEPFNINYQDGSYIQFNGDGFLSQNDQNKFTGNVRYKIYMPDVLSPIQSLSLPGGHLGIDDEGVQVWLDYYNAIHVDVESFEHNKLLFDDGSCEILLDNKGCGDCDIWMYNEAENVWKMHDKFDREEAAPFEIEEEGVYVLAKQNQYNLFDGRLSVNGINQPAQAIDIFEGEKFVERIFTTQSGKWFTHLAFDKTYRAIVNLRCDDEYEFTINSQNDDEVIPDFVINSEEDLFVNLQGLIKDCNDDLLDDIILNVKHGEIREVFVLGASEFDIDINTCESNIEVQFQTTDYLNRSPWMTYEIMSDKIDMKSLIVCGQDQEGYFNMDFGGIQKLSPVTNSEIRDGRTVLQILDEFNPQQEFEIIFSATDEGNLPDNLLNITMEDVDIGGDRYYLSCSQSQIGCGFEEFNIEKYDDDSGGWIKGSFKGTFWVKSKNNNTAHNKEIKADFLIPRNF